MMKVLILGATGMLGYSLFSNLSEYPQLSIFGTVRSIKGKEYYFEHVQHQIIQNVDVNHVEQIESAITQVNPDVVINCIGLIKQHDVSKQHIAAIKVNALLPHEIASICDRHQAKLIHFSTDCVFDGKKGIYGEQDLPTATDLYGKSKCLGEVDYGNHLTLRTSIIGHELKSAVSLIDWFLSQEGRVKGFSKAVFSGLPTAYIAKVLADFVLPKPELTGLYHLSVQPIDKYALISKTSCVYQKQIEIERYDDFVIDRSLDSSKFQAATGFTPPSWDELVEYMHLDYLKRYKK